MVLVRPATPHDVAELIRLRVLLFSDLAAVWGPASLGADDWEERCRVALAEQVADTGVRIAVVDGETGLAACGIGAVDRRLPTPYNPGGLIGHVFGVVTDPAYRKRGYARAIMEDLLAWFEGRGLRRVDLNASPDGQGLYRSLGFEDHPDPVLSRKLSASRP
ncbi:N-acetyltransferase [Planotetraspora thailandica]|uniref:N-acetyltransferase n=1 Tax=Planotetraspora thailandica TaxID=487172 RepID=A0A8J3XYB2_9ACTN|nr:GNAT family N-acetyltransferase [Planotetraspora thailandica]GII57769.1 N-acetyltransferase [Planotetraspora thailandica]